LNTQNATPRLIYTATLFMTYLVKMRIACVVLYPCNDILRGFLHLIMVIIVMIITVKLLLLLLL